ncbi:MAG TPA: hypothetical protein VGD87_18855 [Archangium sp.]
MRPLPLVAGLLALPTLALATSLVPHTLLQRAEQSDRVALVQVLSQKVEETGNAKIPLKTYTRVLVGQNLRGAGPEEVTIVQIGGRLGLQSIEVPGDANFRVGETAVVFMRCRLAPDRCHLVAMGAGKLDVEGDNVFVQDLTNGKWARRTVKSLVAELAVSR